MESRLGSPYLWKVPQDLGKAFSVSGFVVKGSGLRGLAFETWGHAGVRVESLGVWAI